MIKVMWFPIQIELHLTKLGHLLESPVEWGWMCTSCSNMAVGRLTIKSHHSSFRGKRYDHAADRARRCWAVAFNRASGGCLGEDGQLIVPGKTNTDVSWMLGDTEFYYQSRSRKVFIAGKVVSGTGTAAHSPSIMESPRVQILNK